MDYTTIAVSIVIIYLLYNTIETKMMNEVTSLCKDGYVILHGNTRKEVLDELPVGYVFLDYKYTLKGCKTHIFHRDYTTSQYFLQSQHPIYTYSIYKSEGPLISVCPGSHNTAPYLLSKPITLSGKKHTGILYNSDLVHAGVLHKENGRHYEEQYKLCHKSDLKRLKHVKNESLDDVGVCRNTFYTDLLLRKLSLLFNFPLNYIYT